MSFLYLLEGLRNPVLDFFFGTLTHLGSEVLFMAIAIAMFWCISKSDGLYLLTVGFFGTLINQFLKIVCRIPRPWVRDPSFTIVESARGDATGYSFPSGHTQSIAGTGGSIAVSSKNKWVRVVSLVIVALVALSRMYLGVHTPADVLVSLLVAAVLVFALYPLFKKCEEKPYLYYIIGGVLTLLSLGYVLFTELYAWPSDIDAVNLEHAVKNGYTMLGCGAAMIVSLYIEQKYIKFDTRAPFYAQVLKVVLGLALILGIKAGLKPVLNPIFGGHLSSNAVRYFLIVVFAVCVWPLTFNWFKNGCKMKKWVKKALIAAACLAIVLCLLAGLLFWVVTRETKTPAVSTEGNTNPLITSVGETMLSAHRSAGDFAPENTMMALREILESSDFSIDIFEFDIHITADGECVLLHDATLDRTSDSAEYFGVADVRPEDKTLAELKNLNMGEGFTDINGDMPYKGLRGNDIPEELRIVTLEEALGYIESKGEYRYIIEIKSSGSKGRECADKLYSALAELDILDRAVIGTFHNEITEYMDSKYPDMLRSAGFNECIKFYIYSLLNLKAPEGTFNFEALQIPTTDYTVNLGTSRVINYAHKNNIAVQYWTINDISEMERLQSIGADAIMTDIPDKAAAVLNRPEK